MRNRFPGNCYRCHTMVAAGAGHFERFMGGWRTQHAQCAIDARGTPDPVRQANNDRVAQERAKGTGKAAQRARKRLREAARGSEA